jgi:hypothetical protein
MKIHHIVCGDDNWDPTADELHNICTLFCEAQTPHEKEFVIATRQGITVTSFEVEPDDVFQVSPASPTLTPYVTGAWAHRATGAVYLILMVTNTGALVPGQEPTVVYTDEPDELERSGHNIWSAPLAGWHASFVKHEGPFPDRV